MLTFHDLSEAYSAATLKVLAAVAIQDLKGNQVGLLLGGV